MSIDSRSSLSRRAYRSGRVFLLSALALLLGVPAVTHILKTGIPVRTAEILAAPQGATGTQYGLEWPGTGSTRRMLYWHNPFPIYNATYIFKVYPREKTTGTYKYYTTFFWGNDGNFVWDGGAANTYYGAHPYPRPAPSGPGQWEISAAGHDITTGFEVDWNRWHTQAFRAWRESSTRTRHEFYYDLPDTTKVITYTIDSPSWANKNPPVPAIVIGQAPNYNGASWGGYPGWEEFYGVIRGIQIYSGLLSVSEIQSEIATPQSTAKGQQYMWYLNVNPRPGDVADKKSGGTPHNPSWAGTPAFEWSSGATTPPDTTVPTVSITAPAANSTVQGSVTVSANAADNTGVAGVQFLLDGANLSSEDTTSPYSISWSTTGTANGSHTLQAVARDAAGNRATSASVVVNVSNTDTSPPLISNVTATGVTSSSAAITWTTNEPADSQVDYGPTTAYGSSTALDTAKVTSHSQTLSGLSAATTYNYRVRSRDAGGNTSTSANFTFTTSGVTNPSTGLTGYWPFNEGAGTGTADASGFNNNGILTNSPTWVNGVSGKALQFSASDNRNDSDDPRVLIGRTFDIPGRPFTITAWVMPTDYGDYRAIFSKRDRYSASTMRLDLGLIKTYGRVYMNSSSSYLTFAYAPPVNVWTHLAVVASSSGTQLYVNGVLRETMGVFNVGLSSSATVAIGGTGEGSGGDNDPFKGALDEIRVYNKALSASEVQQVYAFR